MGSIDSLTRSTSHSSYPMLSAPAIAIIDAFIDSLHQNGLRCPMMKMSSQELKIYFEKCETSILKMTCTFIFLIANTVTAKIR